MPIKFKSTDRITIAGIPDQGKTVLAKYLASLCEPDLMIYDPMDQYTKFPDECRYIPRSNDLSEFEAMCKTIYHRGNLTFFIEECERYIGQGKPMGTYTFDLINRGRNYGIGIVAVTRRIQRISKDFFDLCKYVFFFQCGLTSHDYVGNLIGKKNIEIIKQLPPYHFLFFNIGTLEGEVATLKMATSRPHVETVDKLSKLHQAAVMESAPDRVESPKKNKGPEEVANNEERR